MGNFQKIILLLVFAGTTLTLGGCLSQLFGFDTGGKLIWWCDKCQAQIGSPQTHVCGMTRYDPATGKDVPLPGISQEAVDREIAKRQAESAASDTGSVGAVSGASPQMSDSDKDKDLPEKHTPRWKFWDK